MSADILALGVTFAALLVACVVAYRDAKRREAFDTRATIRTASTGSVAWTLTAACYLCAGRVGASGHYILANGGSRCVCDHCAAVVARREVA